MKIAPSLLAAPLTKLSDTLKALKKDETDFLHLDVMDGHFVPQLSYGEAICEAISKETEVPLDVHLMVSRPEAEAPKYFNMKPGYITFHYETTSFPIRLAQSIREKGIKAGLAVNPVTPIEAITDLIPYFDMFLIMSIEPGFYGQSFLENSYDRISRFSKLRNEYSLKTGNEVLIEVDGGVTDKNIRQLKDVGVNICVAGSFVFKSGNPGEKIRELKMKCQ
ncbi:MAG: ribulose-phosphate 3-epimerase [Spirochaetia bacterium]|nr:ribulose-phosphate 3-epimerase [Spirochaetia bacterium]